MIKFTVNYEDFDENPVTQDLYFHLSKNDIIEMETSTEGGLSKIIPQLLESKDFAKILRLFKEIVAAAYGIRDPDNPSKFNKDKAATEEFMESLAFDALLTLLMSDEKQVTAFIVGIAPKDLMAQVLADQNSGTSEGHPAWVREGRQPTDQELRNMSPDQLREAMRAKMSSSQE